MRPSGTRSAAACGIQRAVHAARVVVVVTAQIVRPFLCRVARRQRGQVGLAVRGRHGRFARIGRLARAPGFLGRGGLGGRFGSRYGGRCSHGSGRGLGCRRRNALGRRGGGGGQQCGQQEQSRGFHSVTFRQDRRSIPNRRPPVLPGGGQTSIKPHIATGPGRAAGQALGGMAWRNFTGQILGLRNIHVRKQLLL